MRRCATFEEVNSFEEVCILQDLGGPAHCRLETCLGSQLARKLGLHTFKHDSLSGLHLVMGMITRYTLEKWHRLLQKLCDTITSYAGAIISYGSYEC